MRNLYFFTWFCQWFQDHEGIKTFAHQARTAFYILAIPIQKLVWFSPSFVLFFKGNTRLGLNKNEPKAYSSNAANLYPVEQHLINTIATHHHVEADNILLTAGGDDGLRIIFNRKSSGKVIILTPDFPQYKKWSDAFGQTQCFIPVGFPGNQFPEDLIRKNLDSNTSIVILSTVGNPTGYIIPDGFIEEMSMEYPHTLFILDEVYSDYLGADFTRLAVGTDNVVALRSLSKLGVPGLRVGYLLSTATTIDKLRQFALAHPVAGPCIVPAIKVLRGEKRMKRLIARQKVASLYLFNELTKRGLESVQSPANWLNLNLGSAAGKVHALLAAKKVDVLIHSHPMLNGWLRISTPSKRMMKGFLRVLDNIMDQPFAEQNGLLVFLKGRMNARKFAGYSFVAKIFGEIVDIDHFNIIFPSRNVFLREIKEAVANGFRISEGPGIYPQDFCSEADAFPANLSMNFCSLISRSGGLVVMAAPQNSGDQLSEFLHARSNRGVHHIAIKVQHLQSKIEHWLSKGFKQQSPIAEDGGIKQCFLTNQQGQIIELIERTGDGMQTFTCNNIQQLRKSETMKTALHPNHKIHVNISDVVKNFNAVGMSTPTIAAKKCEMLLHEDFIGHNIAFVVIDAIRCSSTIQASLGAGARAITIMVKGGERGTKPSEALAISKKLGLKFQLGGELNGQPIPEGIIGNSPSEAANCSELENAHLHFQSTNFGGTFTEVTDQVRQFRRIGGHADIYVASFVNAEAVIQKISASGYDKVYIACGGFYNCLSLEDDIAGGILLDGLGFGYNDMDDEARVMLSLFHEFNTPEKQYEVLRTNWISASLSCFGKEGDVKTVLMGDGIPPETWAKMATIVPMVQWHEDIPIIFSQSN